MYEGSDDDKTNLLKMILQNNGPYGSSTMKLTTNLLTYKLINAQSN